MGAACCRLIGFGRRSLPDPIMYLLLGYLVPKNRRDREVTHRAQAQTVKPRAFFKDFVM
jgi:hypothetical protein